MAEVALKWPLRWDAKRRCDMCFTEKSLLKNCAGCRGVVYCTKECQRAGWLHHKQRCCGLPKSANLHSSPHGMGEFLDAVAKKTTRLPDSTPATAWKTCEPCVGMEVFKRFPIALVETSNRGRGLVTSDKIVAGTLLLEDDPIAFVPQQQYGDMLCHQCCSRLDQNKKIRCQGCDTVVWCSPKCQTAAAQHHTVECQVVQQFPHQSRKGLHGVRLFVLLAIAGEKAKQIIDFHHHGDHNSSESSQSQAKVRGMAQQVLKVLNLCISQVPTKSQTSPLPLPQPLPTPTITTTTITPTTTTPTTTAPTTTTPTTIAPTSTQLDAMIGYIHAVQTNGIFVTDLEGRRLASAYYSVVPLVNHSCDPNAVMGFSGKRVSIRALRNIDKNEEIFISYTELYRPTHLRRLMLREKKRFECECRRCMFESSSSTATTIGAFACADKTCQGHATARSNGQVICVLCDCKRSESATKLQQLIDTCAATREQAGQQLQELHFEEALKLLNRALKETQGKLHATHYERFECHVMCTDVLAQMSPLPCEQLFSQARLTLHCMELVYHGGVNPRCTKILQAIGDCLASSNGMGGSKGPQRQAALSIYQLAHTCLKTAWGQDNVATLAMQHRIDELNRKTIHHNH